MKRQTTPHLRFELSHFVATLLAALGFNALALAEGAVAAEPAVPVFKDGEAQIVRAFQDPDFWIREDLWVETEFDSVHKN